MKERLHWLLTRPRALFRATRKLGLRATLQLARIKFAGRQDKTYVLRLPNYPFPFTIRGGRSSDAAALYELLVMGEYEDVGNLDSPRFIIDGGANIGIASIFFLERYPGARVVSVEPDPANLALCRTNLAPYSSRVTLIQGGIWKSDGHLVLDRQQEEWATRVKVENHAGPDSIMAFAIPSLMAYGNGTVDLLKLDIEGSEREVFEPGCQAWLPAVRNIVIELHSQECRERFFSALEGYRYERQDHKWSVACRNLVRSSAFPENR